MGFYSKCYTKPFEREQLSRRMTESLKKNRASRVPLQEFWGEALVACPRQGQSLEMIRIAQVQDRSVGRTDRIRWEIGCDSEGNDDKTDLGMTPRQRELTF